MIHEVSEWSDLWLDCYKDSKNHYAFDEVELARKIAYGWCKHATEVLHISPSHLDAILYKFGKRLRRRYGDGIIPRIYNEIRY